MGKWRRRWERWPEWKQKLSFETRLKARRQLQEWSKFKTFVLGDKWYWKRGAKKRAAALNAARTSQLLYGWRRALKPRVPKRRAILAKIARQDLAHFE